MEWNTIMQEIFKEYKNPISQELKKIKETGMTVYPVKGMFRPYSETVCPFSRIKFVIVTPAPFKDINADGLAFSSKGEMPKLTRMFLKTVFKGLFSYIKESDFDKFFKHSDLTSWANQGIGLFNYSVTRDDTKTHFDIWKEFTNKVMIQISKHHDYLAVLLIGEETFDLEEHFLKENQRVWKIKKKHLSDNNAFANAYDWFDSNYEDAVNNNLIAPDPANASIFDLASVFDEEGFINEFKKFIVQNRIPYAGDPITLNKWKEYIKPFMAMEFNNFFNLSLT